MNVVGWTFTTLGITFGIQLFFFLIAYTLQFDKVTDFAGAINFIVLAVLGLVWRGTYFPRQAVLSGMVVIWAVRLGGFLLLRVLQRGKDERFDEMRSDFLKFAGFWVFQVVWVFVVSLPVTFLNWQTSNPPLNAVDYVGWSLWFLGWLLETVADAQRYRHPRESGFLQSGLWSISRHPNYFGEILLWWGIWLSAANGLWSVSVACAILALASPLLTMTLLMFVSGMPIAEKRDQQRYRSQPGYAEYLEGTSPLWPLPVCCYRPLPTGLKRTLFLDRRYPAPETATDSAGGGGGGSARGSVRRKPATAKE